MLTILKEWPGVNQITRYKLYYPLKKWSGKNYASGEIIPEKSQHFKNEVQVC